MGAYTIRELENLSGIKAHTIRIWEKRYGLIAPQRTSTNIRTYCDTELKKLLNISILNRSGLKISKIAQLSQDEIVTRIGQYTMDLSSAESQIESLTLAMIDMDEYRFEQVLARVIIQFGFEEAVMRVLYPFFVRIGIMWQTGSITPVQEHFISNLVKQKFFVAIDSLVAHQTPDSKKFVFFLPEGEFHEIGLLFLCYLAKKRGFQTIYLGQSLPMDDLLKVIESVQVDYLVTASTTSINGSSFLTQIERLSKAFGNRPIFVSGSGISNTPGEWPSNVIAIDSPVQFLEKLEEIIKTKLN